MCTSSAGCLAPLEAAFAYDTGWAAMVSIVGLILELSEMTRKSYLLVAVEFWFWCVCVKSGGDEICEVQVLNTAALEYGDYSFKLVWKTGRREQSGMQKYDDDDEGRKRDLHVTR